MSSQDAEASGSRPPADKGKQHLELGIVLQIAADFARASAFRAPEALVVIDGEFVGPGNWYCTWDEHDTSRRRGERAGAVDLPAALGLDAASSQLARRDAVRAVAAARPIYHLTFAPPGPGAGGHRRAPVAFPARSRNDMVAVSPAGLDPPGVDALFLTLWTAAGGRVRRVLLVPGFGQVPDEEAAARGVRAARYERDWGRARRVVVDGLTYRLPSTPVQVRCDIEVEESNEGAVYEGPSELLEREEAYSVIQNLDGALFVEVARVDSHGHDGVPLIAKGFEARIGKRCIQILQAMLSFPDLGTPSQVNSPKSVSVMAVVEPLPLERPNLDMMDHGQ